MRYPITHVLPEQKGPKILSAKPRRQVFSLKEASVLFGVKKKEAKVSKHVKLGARKSLMEL